ncbi:MAG: HAD hydrolase family protein [Caldilineaceae bacterium]|nr:HAD hydrolase family protein [Caldilineaceae bacterium]
MNRRLDRYKVCEIVELVQVADQPSAKILFFMPDMVALAPLLERLPTTTRAMLSNRYNLVQLLSTTADKAHALQHLVAGWGLSLDDVIAVGDDVNDVGMVQRCGLGVAVRNAVPEVLAVADHVTATNDEDGVALLLEELLRGER